MSARFVLIETQLKALQGAKLASGQSVHHQNHTEGGERRKESLQTQEHGETAPSNEDEKDCIDDPLITAAPVSMARETTALAPPKTPVSKPTYRTALKKSSFTPQSSFSATATSTSLYRHTLTAASRATSSSGTVLSLQLARTRAEQQLPLPPSPHSHTPPHSNTHHTPKTPSLYSPSSPVSTASIFQLVN